MLKKVSKTSEINDRLAKENRIKVLDSSSDMQRVASVNEYMGRVRQEYQMKEINSQISAAHVILNA